MTESTSTATNNPTPTGPTPTRPSTQALTRPDPRKRLAENGADSAPPTPREPAASRGKTSVADGVVEKIAGMAAREVPGVHAMGGGFARTFGAMRDRVPGTTANVSRGVRVEVGEKQTAVDLELVVEYGVTITDVAGGVRANVIDAVERMTGLQVVEVNISVNDVHLPDDESTDGTEPRVQ
ncbi:Asp23/Gls24 family envelope stress response protein [Streptodolium elevatio]|uniref:Asp23/Gls24 family envelope stress response protein n=1 Tax=Streptodolium elevatio TaxID=3157996 RepID=A0ABV3DW72_9ACTN